jgi:DNA polymerase-1
MGWKVLDVPGVEADDVIGTLSAVGSSQGIEVVVSSGDKDLAQLVNEHITIIDTMNGKRRDLVGVQEEFGVPASLMLDYQILVGDTVDNVPGVQKVGPKTAVKLLLEYGSLDNLMANADQVKGVVGENLRKAVDWLPTGRQLLKIRTDCDLNEYVPELPSLESIRLAPPNEADLLAFYEKYGFKGLVRSRGAGAPESAASKTSAKVAFVPNDDLFAEPEPVVTVTGDKHYETILTWAQFDTWLPRLEAAECVAIDTETTSLDAMRADLVGISWSVKPGEAAYLPLRHEGPDAPAQLPLLEVLAKLKAWLENPRKLKVGQHVKYDRHVFANQGIEVRGYAHDTMLQSYVLEVHKPHSLTSLALRHVGRTGLTYEDMCGKGVHQISFAQVDVEKASEYSCI